VSVNAGGTLMGNGTIGGLNVGSGGVAAPGHSIGTLTVAGNVGFGSGSTYLVEVNPAGQSDLIAASGSAALTGGTVRVLGTFAPGLPYTILTAQGGVNGAFAGVATDSTFAFLSPVLNYMPTSVQLSLERTRSFASAAATPNQAHVAAALDAFPTSNPLFGAVLMQSSTAGARQAFDALSGEIHGSAQTVMLDDSRYLRQAVLGRLRQASFAGEPGPFAALMAGGPDVASTDAGSALAYGDTRAAFPVKAAPLAAPSPSPDIAWWAQGVGAWGSIDSNGNAANVSRSLGGFFTGVDRRFGDYWRAGIAGGYTNASVQANARSSSANIDTAHLAAYAGASYGAWNLRSGAAASWSTIDSNRSIAFPGFAELATARYNGSTAQMFGEIGYGIAFGRIAAEPFAGLAWAHLDTNAFSEQGGIAALAGSSTSDDVGYTTTGARIATNIPLQDGMMLTPRASAAWQHAFGDLTPGAALTFQSTGIGFDIAGVPLARDAALVEGGFDLRINPNAMVGLSYTGQIAGSTNDHAVKGNLTWRF
jgi:outer membrane autotransporter protein